MARDYYEALGIPRKASARDIKAAYRKLARQYHPDVTGDDPQATERFKEITEAYETLSDEKRRRAYDLFGHPQDEGFQFPGFDKLGAFADIFSDFLGGPGDPTAPEPGVDVELGLALSFEEAFAGGEQILDTNLRRPCSECDGEGAPATATWKECVDCEGSGKKTKLGPIPFGRGCPSCNARGRIPSDKCKACGGTGTRDEKGRVKVQVPAGVADGTRLRLRGRGSAGRNGGPPGDLYVRVKVKPDARFDRDRDDLLVQVRVPLSTALTGGEVEVELPVGAAKMKVPPGTQGGQTFRLRGKGFRRVGGGGVGDALVTVQVRIPKDLSAEDQAAILNLVDRAGA
jgi:molecular chaperone DnaJ